MRIALNTSLMIGTQLEGLGYYLSNVLNELQSADRTNHYVVLMPASHESVFPLRAPNYERVIVPDWAGGPLANILWTYFVLPVILHRRRIDVFHLPDARRVLMWKPCRVVTTVHDMTNLKLKGRVDPIRNVYHRFLRRRVMRLSDRFITVSENSKNDMREAGFPSQKIAVVPNGVAATFHPRSKAEAVAPLAQYKLPPKFVLCVSRLEHPQKNHVTLLRAWARLKGRVDHKLVLVGKKWWNWDVVMDEIKHLHLQDDVVYVDYVSGDDLPLFYNAADLFVFPSLYEGFGMPVLEAMASGTPVIAAKNSSIAEYFGRAAHMFDALDDAALGDAIFKCLTNKAYSDQLRESGLKTAGEYSWRRSAEAHVKVFEAAAALN